MLQVAGKVHHEGHHGDQDLHHAHWVSRVLQSVQIDIRFALVELRDQLRNVDVDWRVERHEDSAMVLAPLQIEEKFVEISPRNGAVGKVLHLEHEDLV